MKITRNIGAAMARNLEDYSQRAKRNANAALREGAEEILATAVANAPSSSGALKRSGRIVARGTGSGSTIYSIEFGGKTAPYAMFIHEGTMPSDKAPPKEKILKWVQETLGLSGREAQRAAYVIGRSLKRGRPPNKFLERAFRSKVPTVYAKYRRGVKNAYSG